MKLLSRFFSSALFAFAALLISLRPLPAQAHKLNIFAWSDGKKIYGEAIFSGGRSAKNIQIKVRESKTESNEVLFQTQTDDQGKFRFVPPERAVKEQLDLLIVTDSGDGHRGEWPLTAAEYLLPSATADQLQTGLIDEQRVRRIVQEELSRELTPIKQALAERREKKIGPRDIAGGIGCIIGLAGLLSWLRARKKNEKMSADK
ncbi:MAG: hypothetical protein D3924_17715 [Candidatus Electrothrix sp. AR4]|nr:hypothetical protein [Candidatus Electrothrix sp. AR4]